MGRVHARAVRCDGSPESYDLSPRAIELCIRMCRIAFVIEQHRRAIAMQSERLAGLEVELARELRR